MFLHNWAILIHLPLSYATTSMIFVTRTFVDTNFLNDDTKGNNAGMGDQHTDASTLNLPNPSISKLPFPFPLYVSRPCCPWSCGSWQSALPPEGLSGTGSHG